MGAAVRWPGNAGGDTLDEGERPGSSVAGHATDIVYRRLGYPPRGALPHRDEIAVDSDSPGRQHRLYDRAASPDPADRNAYANQFRRRKNAAIAHVRKAWQDNWNE